VSLRFAKRKLQGFGPPGLSTLISGDPMYKQLQRVLPIIALLCGVMVSTAPAQTNATNSSSKLSNQQMMDRMNHMSTPEKAEMFDKMTNNEKMEAMKMAGHDMSKMSDKQRTDMMSKVTTEQKAEMFDKMPMDTKMATMRKAMKENTTEKTGKK
jgi:hypothetical protein